jgi:diguanylate cyclase (GGDEF)-like protein
LQFNSNETVLLAGLCGFGSLALILRKISPTRETRFTTNSLFVIFAWLVLGVPAGAIVILVSHLVEWLWVKMPWFKQGFNFGAAVVCLQIAGAVFSWLNPGGAFNSPVSILAILLALAAYIIVNHFLVGAVVWLASGENFVQSGALNPSLLALDYSSLSIGAVAAVLWPRNPYLVVLCLLALYPVFATLRLPALERESETDPKTGLFNARYFERALQAELNRANRFDRPVTVVMADLDWLRNINNTYGHLAGDEVLVGVADILKRSMRDYDVVARFGGEEFAILIPEANPRDVFAHIDAIRQDIEMTDFKVSMHERPIRATMSFGLAGRAGLSQTAKEILNNSDVALYRAKQEGRNLTWIFTNGQAKRS